jgi:methionine biosynthesis protein MetW
MSMTHEHTIRLDHKLIRELIPAKSSVLDLGCGTGELLSLLIAEKQVRGHGIEIDEQAIYACVAKGLNVFHGDIDSGLTDYKDGSFDYVILNQSLQQVKRIETVLSDAMRVGRKVIVGFPNFAYYRARCQLFFRGRAPMTSSLPYTWFESPNVHFLSILDFRDYCKQKHLCIEKKYFIGVKRQLYFFPNVFAQAAVYQITR